jgi:hypothetical protein
MLAFKGYTMTPAQSKAIQELRAAGWAVILWTPEELNGADPSDIEDGSIQFAAEYLIPEEPETETGEDLAQFYGPSCRI